DPARRLGQYPHQFSGGMRQRMMAAMALGCNPALILADEPTTALDVTIQAQILELLQDLSRRLGVAMLIITHNLGVVARYADRVNVMYAGRIIERGTAAEIYADPRHPYTLGLLRSVPRLDEPIRSRLNPIDGQPPDLTRLPPGCAFAPRCAYRIERCTEVPPLAASGAPGHMSACWEAERLAKAVTA
ncbi:MAG: ABC transporter ATP-binding protein, partial [Proteobacteria bacterium]|nr:ABC transporter ATP-binding protein [Pseudomonadota bacterium]